MFGDVPVQFLGVAGQQRVNVDGVVGAQAHSQQDQSGAQVGAGAQLQGALAPKLWGLAQIAAGIAQPIGDHRVRVTVRRVGVAESSRAGSAVASEAMP